MIRVQVDLDKLVAEARQDPGLAMLPIGVVRTLAVAGNIVFVWMQVDQHGEKNIPLEAAAQQIHGLCHKLLEDHGLNEEEQGHAFEVVDRLLAREIEAAHEAGKLHRPASVPSTTVKES
jgi:hypothetical protein